MRVQGRRAVIVAVVCGAGCVHPGGLPGGTIGGRDLSLRYEGTCQHLACCSARAVAVPNNTGGAYACDGRGPSSCSRNVGWFAPGFTCNPLALGRYRQPNDAPFLSCNDYERWLSIPGLTSDQCGTRYLVCHRGVRVTAVARDRSASNESGLRHYEGSFGLLLALGADHDARETFVSIYALDQREQIAADPNCVGD